MRYVKSRYAQHQEEMAYRIYVTDSMFLYADGKHLKKRYIDLINRKPADNRSGDEIALDVITRMGLKI